MSEYSHSALWKRITSALVRRHAEDSGVAGYQHPNHGGIVVSLRPGMFIQDMSHSDKNLPMYKKGPRWLKIDHVTDDGEILAHREDGDGSDSVVMSSEQVVDALANGAKVRYGDQNV